MGPLRLGAPLFAPRMRCVASTAVFSYCSLLYLFPKIQWLFLTDGYYFCILSPWHGAWQREDAQCGVCERDGGKEGRRRDKKERSISTNLPRAKRTHTVTHSETLVKIRQILETRDQLSLSFRPPGPIPEQNEATGNKAAPRQRPQSHTGSMWIEGLLFKAPSCPDQPHLLSSTSEHSGHMLRIPIL